MATETLQPQLRQLRREVNGLNSRLDDIRRIFTSLTSTASASARLLSAAIDVIPQLVK